MKKVKKMDPLVLEGTKLLPSMAGKKYEDDDPEKDFGDAERRYFKESKVGSHYSEKRKAMRRDNMRYFNA